MFYIDTENGVGNPYTLIIWSHDDEVELYMIPNNIANKHREKLDLCNKIRGGIEGLSIEQENAITWLSTSIVSPGNGDNDFMRFRQEEINFYPEFYLLLFAVIETGYVA